jgi:hypothetical protein
MARRCKRKRLTGSIGRGSRCPSLRHEVDHHDLRDRRDHRGHHGDLDDGTAH